MTTTPTTTSPQFQETALDWWQRSEQCRRHRRGRPKPAAATPPPTSPSAAAMAFVQGTSGISYVDAAWQRSSSSSSSSSNISISTAAVAPSVLVLEGAVAKTWTLRSLAARFVVATRPSRFDDHPHHAHRPDDSSSWQALPQVIVLDSQQDFGIPNSPALAHVVRATLLRQQQQQQQGSLAASSKTTTVSLQDEFKECLQRIHICATDNASGWVAILEVLRHELLRVAAEAAAPIPSSPSGVEDDNPPPPPAAAAASSSSPTPVLLLWDGFLQEPNRPSGCSNSSSNSAGGGGSTTAAAAAATAGRSRDDTSSITKTEILRQLARLLQDCPHVSLVVTTHSHSHTHSHIHSHHTVTSSSGTTTTPTPPPTAHSHNYGSWWMSTLRTAMANTTPTSNGDSGGGISSSSSSSCNTSQQWQQHPHPHHHSQYHPVPRRPQTMFHRIMLERRSGKDCVATVLPSTAGVMSGGGGAYPPPPPQPLQQFSFSLSLGGILS